ncbi:PAS domain-containing protein [Rhizobium brockwellii]|uniref:PAS domain-containing protein n=1 Tax=Rhizobium brockwellii TaxID=3019932 RepID=UPI003F9E1D98
MQGDSAVAELFGLPPADCDRGLPLEAYLSYAHADDRANVARLMTESIINHRPHQLSFRTNAACGQHSVVNCFTRPFLDKDNNPRRFTASSSGKRRHARQAKR